MTGPVPAGGFFELNVVFPEFARGANLPLLLIFAGVVGGLFAFGVTGLFIGPVVLAVSYTLLADWIDEGGTEPGAPSPRPDAAAEGSQPAD